MTKDFQATHEDFAKAYMSPEGKMHSDSQTAYALAICFNLFPKSSHKTYAGNRLADIVKENAYNIGTGFAGTPFICEALVQTGHTEVAYSMLQNRKCPSWLYPVTMGATTIWERWDSMLPDGSINPGEMTSFNHYAYGVIATFMHERLAGLKKVEAGWKKSRVQPIIGANVKSASASHLTPFGRVYCSWKIGQDDDQSKAVTKFHLAVSVPPNTTMDVVLPSEDGARMDVTTVGSGDWTFARSVPNDYHWVEGPEP